jgi:hypothetical protein
LEIQLHEAIERVAVPSENHLKSVREQMSSARQRRDEKYLRVIFQDLHPTDEKITKESLISGLIKLNVGPSCGETDDDIFLQFDKNCDGHIDFDEFRTAVLRPSHLESWCKNIPWWQAIADAIPIGRGEIDPLRTVANLTDAQIATICAEAETLIRQEFILQVKQLRQAIYSIDASSPSNGSAQPKFTTFKANVGNCDDYYNGLKGRIGRDFFILICANFVSVTDVRPQQGRLNRSSWRRCGLSTAQSSDTTLISPHQTTASQLHQKKNGQ